MRAEKQMTILLVEDEVITAMAEKMTLEKFGYTVITANTGEAAVAIVEKIPAIDLVLMDINLGSGIDGTEAAAIILRQRDLPVVFLSSHMEPEVVAKTEKITSYGYVVKNSSSTVLDASIKMAFKLFEAIKKEKAKECQMEAALEALRKSEQRLNFHVNNSPLATIEWTNDFIVTRWSGEAEKIFGWKQSETIGKSIMNLQMIYDEDIPIVQKTMERLSDGSSKHVVSTNRNYTKEGKVIICEWYNSVLLSPQGEMISVMSQVMDITERKRDEEQLRFLSSVAENITDSITITDANFAITYINKMGEKLFGYTLDELKGQTPGKFNAEPMAEQIQQELYKIVSSGNTYLGESLNRRKDGSIFYCEYKVTPLKDSKGIIYGYTSIQRDITERIRAEESLKISEALFREIYDHMKSGSAIFTVINDGSKGSDYIIKKINRAGLKMEGKTLAEVIGKKFIDIRPAIDNYGLIPVMKKVWETGESAISPTKIYIDERYANYYENYIFKLPSGEVVTLYNDVTESKRAESQSEAALEAQAQQNAALSKLNQFSIELSILSPDDNLEALITKRIKEIAGAVASIFSEYNPENRTTTTRNIEIEPGLLGKVVSLLGKQVEKIHSTVSDETYRVITKEIVGIRKTLYEASFGAVSRPVGAAIQAMLKVDRFIGIAYLIEGKLYGTSLLAMSEGQPDPSKQILESFSFLAAVSLRRKQAEDAFQESEQRYHELFNHISSGVAIYEVVGKGKDFIFKDFNRAGERLDGARKEDVIGKSIYQVRPGIEKFGILEVFKRVFATGIPEHYPAKFYQDEKMQGWYDNFVYRLPSGEIVVVYDNITERKRAESQREAALEALRESEDRYRDLVENSQDLICTHDLEGKLLSVNEAAARLTGYPIKDLLGMNMANLLDPEVRRTFNAYLKRVRAAGRTRGRMRIRTASGEARYWEYDNTLRTKGVTVPVVRGMAHDITERMRAEEEIHRQLTEKEILLKEVHHRIKNNIASIGGLLSLHMQSVTNPEAIAVLQDAIGRVDSMRILYDKLLITEDYRDISVKNYVESLADAVLALFPERAKIKLEKRIVDFYLDPKQLFPLGLIINELITNKMKYAFIDREAGLITISLKTVAKHVTLDIRDNGNKLPAGFDMDKTKGFGLMLVKMLSQQLGGGFSIEKQKGTRCVVEFDI